jgi:four helix bundle protein
MGTDSAGNGSQRSDEYHVVAVAGGYQRLAAWQTAMDLVDAVYGESRTWPKEEVYGLTAQVRRAAVAIPSNIAEGHGRTGAREFAHHVSIAFGSLGELETQLFIAQRQGFSSEDAITSILAKTGEVRRITRGLLNSLRTQSPERQQR